MQQLLDLTFMLFFQREIETLRENLRVLEMNAHHYLANSMTSLPSHETPRQGTFYSHKSIVFEFSVSYSVLKEDGGIYSVTKWTTLQ